MNGKALWNAKGGETVQERKPAGRGQAVQRALMTAAAIVVAVLLIGAMVAPLCAQSYPNKPIRFIVPMGVGGSQDIVGRIIGQRLAERIGQSVVIDNRPGAGSNIGYEFAAKARPDGYTLLLGCSNITISPSLYKKLNYDPIKDFAPISLSGHNTFLLIVRSSLPIENLKALLAYARANPGKLNYGSAGIGASGQLANELFNSLAKINVMHVPYKSAGQMLIGLISGEVDMLLTGAGVAMPQIQAGKVRVLMVMSKQRVPSLPNVPTAKEAGIDNLEDVHTWYGILAPAGTPRNIVNWLNSEWIKTAAMPDTIEKMQNAGFKTVSGTPEQFSEFLKADLLRWAKVIKEANIMSID